MRPKHRYDDDMSDRSASIIDVRLLDHPVQIADLAPFPPECGAECVFLGRTRGERHEQHGRLTKLSYEAYQPLAERTMRELVDQAIDQFGCAAVRLHHAVGDVAIGEASVLVQVACGHRDQAFRACRFLIDELKRRVPIWKREVWADGTTWAEGVPVNLNESGDRA
jgi:molybdopterin synthase catalytic subunit